MRVVFRLSAIVVAFAAIAGSLTACGQRGSLYMPQVPALPAARGASAADETVSPSTASEASAASAASSASSAAGSTTPSQEPPLIKLAPAPANPKSN